MDPFKQHVYSQQRVVYLLYLRSRKFPRGHKTSTHLRQGYAVTHSASSGAISSSLSLELERRRSARQAFLAFGLSFGWMCVCMSRVYVLRWTQAGSIHSGGQFNSDSENNSENTSELLDMSKLEIFDFFYITFW